MSQNTGRRQMANTWKEDFQDLSLFCHDAVEQSNFTKNTSIGREISTVPDDELNTPEIVVGYEDYILDSWPWPQPESLDDLNLWDDQTVLKRGYDNNGGGSMLVAETFGEELPEETNQNCINIDVNLGEDSLQQKDLSSVVNNKTCEFFASDELIVQKEYEIYEEEPVGQNNEFSSVINIQTCGEIEVDNNEQTVLLDNISENFSSVSQPKIMEVKEVEPSKNLGHIAENVSSISQHEIIEVKEIEPPKDLCHLAVTSKTKVMRSGLHLPLTMETTADVLNTPEVLARLGSQPGFDLLSFVLDDNPGAGPSTSCGSSNARPAPSSNSDIIGKIVKEELDLEKSIEGNSCEESVYSSVGLVQQDEHYIVAPPGKSSKICLVLKKTPSAKRNKSSLKTVSECCSKKIKKYSVKDEALSSDEDYEPPEKVKRNPRSKRTKSECSRYRELRDRNNEASRKSRQNRKAREEETKSQLATLESENQRLKIRAEELEKLVDTLRKALLNAMVKGKD